MTTFCECETCKKIKEHLEHKSFPICTYCGKNHALKIACPEFKEIQDKAERKAKKLFSCPYPISICGGKYTIFLDKKRALKALKYGEPWRDLTGDNLVFNLMVELIEAKEKINKAIESIPRMDCSRETAINILKGNKMTGDRINEN